MAARIDDLFAGLQAQLRAALLTAGTTITHPGTKGDASEDDWRKMLAAYLPNRYCVDKAQVVDAEGAISHQIDIVIYDRQYSPLLFRHQSCLYVPAESVYAILEVKQDLSRENVKYAGEKVASVRKLKRTSVPIQHVMGVSGAKPPFRILGGLVASRSSWTPAVGQPLVDVLEALADDEQLDVGCALSHGTFEASYGSAGLDSVHSYEAEYALVRFFLTLLAKLQAVGTVPALDVAAYAQWAGPATKLR